MRTRKKLLSLLLAFSMVMSLFAGQIVVRTDADAAGENKIELGTSKKETGYYTYPDAVITLQDEDKLLYHLSISVDSGYMVAGQSEIAGTKGTGILANDSDDVSDVKSEELNTTDPFASIAFDIAEGATKSDIETFIRGVHFTTATDQVQLVSVSATGVKDAKATIAGTEYDLKYFNGHFYGLITNGKQWKDAYKSALEAEFAGVNGYLLTITSLKEDRFIWGTFGNNGKATKGWMGCTRATTTTGTYGNADAEWNPLADFDVENLENNKWRWVSGPEAGQVFGYQSDALGWSGGTSSEGDFVTAAGYFSNWNKNGDQPKEPNGGKLPAGSGSNANYAEGYGYYGENDKGNWNDYPEDRWLAYYVEFGTPDEEFVKDGESIVIVSEEKNSDGTVPATPTPDASATPSASPSILPSDAPSASPSASPSVSPSAAPTVTPTLDPTKQAITGKPEITTKDSIVESGTKLTADVSNVLPADSHATLEYQWYTKESDGTLKPIPNATKKDYTITSATDGKEFVVTVTGTGEYTGTLESDPLTPIGGIVTIASKEKDSKGNDVIKVGTVLEAQLDGVTPAGSHDTLTYQWYIDEGNGTFTVIDGATYKNYVVTDETIGKDLVVEITGNGKYYGSLESVPYDASRTSADIDIGDGKDDPTIPDGKRVIIINPTNEDTIYAIKDESGNTLTNIPTVDGNGNAITPDVTDPAYPGYYQGTDGGVLKFTVDKDKTYMISEIKITKDIDDKDVISPDIPGTDIKTEYDDKQTEDKSDDTTTIIVDPALTDSVYAVLKKEPDGTYTEVKVKKDSAGNYVADPDGTAVWSDGNEKIVKFTGLDAGGTYKVVAKSSDGTISDVTPGEITGGSGDIITPSEPPKKDQTPTPIATTAPGNTADPVIIFTKEEEDKATKFVKEHGTDPSGKIITKVTDLTRDIITSGEAEWKKLTDREKQAVNTKLKNSGCPYTFEELLKLAKQYKIPGFKVIKFMQKKTKAKLKLIKCSGATIVCTSTNKNVATVNKKGVISAKKVGRATLTFTAIKGKYTNRLVIDVRVKKKFKNAKELTKFKSNVIKTPTVLIAKKRLLRKSSKIEVYDLEKGSKVQYTPIKKNILTINKKGKYTGKKKGSTLVRVKINQNKKVYLLYVYVTIY